MFPICNYWDPNLTNHGYDLSILIMSRTVFSGLKTRKAGSNMSPRWTIGLGAKSALFCTVMLGGAAGLPTSAMADHEPHRFARPCNPLWVPPVYTTQPKVVVIPAVHEDRARQVWREPIYETRRVLVTEPAEVVTERVARYDRYGRFLGYQTVERIVRPARQVWREERVLVKPGYWERIIERVCVEPERREVVYEKVLVKPGYWSYPRPTVVERHGRFHSRGVDVRGHYRDSDDWNLSISIGD